MRELENDRLSLSSEITAKRHQLSKCLTTATKNYNLIVKSLSVAGIDAENWNEFDKLIKKVDPHSLEDSKSFPDECLKLATDIVVNETLTLKHEIEDLRTMESEFSNSTAFNKEKSHLISENEYLVSELTKREMENTKNDLDLANKRLVEARSQANSSLQKYIKGLRDVVEQIENYKMKNCNAIRE
eukprot:XP_765732.1 hypothetical protein [Theileria parva strain Muguga]